MARTRQLSELRTEVRQRADLENTTFVSDSELTRYINQSAARLYGRLADRFEGDFVTSATLATVAGTEAYTIHASFFRLASVPPIATINGRYVPLKRWQPQERAGLLEPTTWWQSGAPVYYRLQASDQISLLPIPDGVYSVQVFYIPGFTALSADGDTFDGRNGWEEWIVLDAAIKCLLKEESDASALVAERELIWTQDILPQHTAKDPSGPDVVQDVTRGEWDW